MGRWKWIVIAIAAVTLVGAFVAARSQSGGGGLVATSELQSLIDDGVRLVDVRTPAEFSSGRIAGAENVPLDELEVAAAAWDVNEPVVVYCATGNRSADAAARLGALGFKVVYDLEGGIARWDGDIESGAVGAADAAAPSPSGLPVMYEFYTDW